MSGKSILDNLSPVDPYYLIFQALLERIQDLEYETNKKKKKKITRAQKMLLLKYTGLIDHLDFLAQKKNKAKFLSLLLDSSPDNIEGDLTDISRSDFNLSNKDNYEFLITTLEELDLKAQKEEAEKNLKKIQRKG